MMYHACRRPGRKPSMHRQMLMRESAEQMPDLTHTVEQLVICPIETETLYQIENVGHLANGTTSRNALWWRNVPAMGGNRMAISPRKRSDEHMFDDFV